MKNTLLVAIAAGAIAATGVTAGAFLAGSEAAPAAAAAPAPTATLEAVPEATKAPYEISVQQAGRYYLTTVTPHNASIDALNVAYLGEKPLKTVRARAAEMHDARRQFANRLLKFEWPAEVADTAKALADESAADLPTIREMSLATSEGEMQRLWNKYVGTDSSSASTLRLMLGLPETGVEDDGVTGSYSPLVHRAGDRP